MRRGRSALVWVFVAVFVAWNVWCAFSLIESWQATTTEQNTIGTGRVLEIWALGVAILGLLVLVTRGRKIEGR